MLWMNLRSGVEAARRKLGLVQNSLILTDIKDGLLNYYLQSLQTYKMQMAPSWETSGAKQIPDSYMVPSMPCHCCV